MQRATGTNASQPLLLEMSGQLLEPRCRTYRQGESRFDRTGRLQPLLWCDTQSHQDGWQILRDRTPLARHHRTARPVKGQVALDQGGQIVGKQDMKWAQVRKTLENIQAVLARCASSSSRRRFR